MTMPGQPSLVPSAVDTLPINLALLDETGTIVYMNQAWEAFGEANESTMHPDTVGADYLTATEEAEVEVAARAADGLRELLDAERSVFELEYPCQASDEHRWFLMRAASFTVKSERFIAVAHIDITARVQGEQTAEKFHRAVETAGHAIFITDPEGTITYVNPAFTEITGYTAADAVGETPRLLKSDEMDTGFYTELWETILNGETWEGQVINRRKSGALYYAHQIITPIVEGGEPVEFIAIQTDITEFREQQLQAEKLQNVLRHDLRNQLTVIQGHADVLSEARSTDPSAVDHAATKLTEAVDTLLSISRKAEQLRDFLARQTPPEPLDITEPIQEAVASVRETYPAATLTVENTSGVRALTVPDISVAIEELVENGILHNDAESPSVTITVETTPEWVEIRITDNGVGIPDNEYQPLLAETTSKLNHDTGYGLNMAYWIVRRSGGQLEFSAAEETGTTITLQLLRWSDAS